jgi:hypothetical protein
MNMSPDDLLARLQKYTDLGHAQRNRAFLRQVALLCSSPGTSVPQASGGAAEKIPMADALSLYRFEGNENIGLAEMRSARAKTVLDDVPEGSDLLVVHDMSPLDYSRHNSKNDRRTIGNGGGMGYEYVDCVAVDPSTGTILGVVHDTVISENGPDDQDVMDYDYEPLFADFSADEKKRLRNNHRHQMAVHVNGTADLLSPWHVIDVADREFDDIFILGRYKQNDRDFVIRSVANRNVQIQPYDWIPPEAVTKKQAGLPLQAGHIYVNLKRLIEHVPLRSYKTLPLDARGRVVEETTAKRLAELSIGAFSILLYRDAKRNQRYVRPPCVVAVNVVVIGELHPPPGSKPLCWVLFTSFPVDTMAQMAHVGRLYELRWRIEDYHRLIKSGYHIERSRLNNATKIARHLVVISIGAMTVLQLKRQVDLPSKGDLSNEHYQRVKTAMLQPDNAEIDLALRLFAFIAKHGGWLGRRRDPIGPTILMRGMLHLLGVLDTFCRYGALLEEILENPQQLRKLLGWDRPRSP